VTEVKGDAGGERDIHMLGTDETSYVWRDGAGELIILEIPERKERKLRMSRTTMEVYCY
tara:strand:+ start:408 stop:584 length:177 start_codon:yes stop_codon:yes gene_type:complete